MDTVRWILGDVIAWKDVKEKEKTLNENRSRLLECDLNDVLSYLSSLVGDDADVMKKFIAENFSLTSFEAIDEEARKDLDDPAKDTITDIMSARMKLLEDKEKDKQENLDRVRVLKWMLGVSEISESLLVSLIEENKVLLDEIKELVRKIKNKEGDAATIAANKKELEAKRKKLKELVIPQMRSQKDQMYSIIRQHLWVDSSTFDYGDPLSPVSKKPWEITSESLWDGLKKRVNARIARRRLNKLIWELNWIQKPEDGVLLLFKKWCYRPWWDTSPRYSFRKKLFTKWLRKKTSDWSSFENEYDKKVSEYLKSICPSWEESDLVEEIKARFEKIKDEYREQLKAKFDA